jgi:hypothetical protein
MAPQSERDGLVTAWRALTSNQQAEGWQTIAIFSGEGCRLLAGRHFPGNEEGLLLGFRGVHPPKDELMPQGHGFLLASARLDQSDYGWGWVALCRKPDGNLEFFELMASDVVAALAKLGGVEGRRLLEVALARIHAWQEFMRKGGRRTLGPESEVGLYGELEVLAMLMEQGVSAPVAVASWQGPMDGLHDFQFSSGAIEVKSTASVASFQARVGSLEQLDDSMVSPLFLAGVQLAVDPRGLTLPARIDVLRERLSDLPATRESFDRLLLHAGFHDDDADSYSRQFRSQTIRVFRVDDRFPRLTRTNVAGAVTSAQYEINLSHEDLATIEKEHAVRELGVEQ